MTLLNLTIRTIKMRALIIICLLILFSAKTYSQSVSVGGGLVYGDDIEEPGINLRVYYNLPGNRVCFGPEFSTFLSHKENVNGEDIEIDLYELNLNVHYIFELTHKLGFYPFTGLNFSREKEQIEIAGVHETFTEEKFGLNLGFGAHYAYNKVVFFTEYDHLFGNLHQNSITLGLFYTFGNKSKVGEEE